MVISGSCESSHMRVPGPTFYNVEGHKHMIIVNGQSMEWEEGLTFQRLFKRLGYTIQNPPVLVRVNGTVIKKSEREGYTIPNEASIEIKNLLRGG